MTVQLNTNDSIVALATPSGMGAIAVIRVSGGKSFEIADEIFRSKINPDKKVSSLKSHTVHFGNIYKGDVLLDEVLLTVFRSPNSYTSEDVIEISCHGSTFIQQKIIHLAIRHGARLAREGEFTLRAFLNGKLDLSQSEAVADLVSSDSDASHRLAMSQMRGGYSAEISTMRNELIHLASLVELELDFAEEDVEFANRTQLKTLISSLQSH
ncbi:MAG: tRNA uridine-5-carboxymethylaminomethyl(34) synthesis GTPase MnmE, partial [Bacteroidia bacterium]|nr:tRNA uridine-5-carboxymethylaminomethyl(34) synthesis GTPase MnmE [Bacteroidia bacterium]